MVKAPHAEVISLLPEWSTAGREIHFKYANHTAAGRELKASRFWYYVVANAPGSLYDGYMNVLYGLVGASSSSSMQQ
jgi:hypothetical protein